MESDKLIALIEKYEAAKEGYCKTVNHGGDVVESAKTVIKVEDALCEALNRVKQQGEDPLVLYEGKGYSLIRSGLGRDWIRTFSVVLDLNPAPKEDLDPVECVNRGRNECTIRMDHPQLGGADPCTGCPHLSYHR
jgi:hypothetical protein